MHAFALEGIQIGRQRRHQSFTLASLQLGHATLMQHHRTNQLHIVMALADCPISHLAHHRKSVWQNRIKCHRFLLQTLAQNIGLTSQFLIRQFLVFRAKRIDFVDFLL